MEKLSILAATPESGRRLYDALSGFDAELIQSEDGTFQVEIALTGGDREIVDLLNAIERHVTERRAGPARIALHGRRYTLHADPASPLQ